MECIENIVLAISVFGSGVLAIFILAKYNYLLKRTLAEKGITPATMKINYSEIACIVMGIGFGLGMSSIVTVMNLSQDTMDLLAWAIILMGGGLGLFAAHFIRQKSESGKQR
jgi:apolipoprotein N-acyltransferase